MLPLNLTALPLAKIKRIADALTPHEVRLVGGVVRDLVAGLKPGDVDLCTPATPDEMMAAFTAAGLKFEPTGLDHGTLTVIIQGEGFEITSLRRDVSTDGRRATVAFTRSFAEDAARRDFTINALYATLEGEVYDPTGGVADVLAGHLRFVGDPHERLREDYLRLLRYFRFYARFGKTQPDEITLSALQNYAPRVADLPTERIHPEVMKLLLAPNPLPSLTLMAENTPLLDVLHLDVNLAALARHQAQFGLADPLERLACLLWSHDLVSHLHRARLHPSNVQIKTISQLELHKKLAFSPANTLAWAYRVGYTLAPWQLRCRFAHQELPLRVVEPALKLLASTPAPVFPLKGADLLAAGLTQGPALGRLLHHLEEWWLNNSMPDRTACLKQLDAVK